MTRKQSGYRDRSFLRVCLSQNKFESATRMLYSVASINLIVERM